MKKLFKKNQVIITALAIMIAIAGYLNFTSDQQVLNTSVEEMESEGASGNSDDSIVSATMDDMIIEDEYVKEDDDAEEKEKKKDKKKKEVAEASLDENGEPIDSDTVGEAVLTNASVSLSQAKFNREQTRSKSKELLLEVINNKNISEEAKKEAITKMLSLTEKMEKENATEVQLASKGFPDSIVCISDDCVDVTLSIKELTDIQRTQIEDIVTRKTGFELKNIVISTLNHE